MNARKLIENYGGCARLAELLGLENPKGTRRIHRWKIRNVIPSVWLVKRPDIFKDYTFLNGE
jgi:hypothetical protein